MFNAFQFYPSTGPIEGGTQLTIDGINLGRSFSDIQNSIKVAHVGCQPLRDAYNTASRIICITGPSHLHKMANGSVVLQLRHDRQFLAVSLTPFQYVVRTRRFFKKKTFFKDRRFLKYIYIYVTYICNIVSYW